MAFIQLECSVPDWFVRITIAAKFTGGSRHVTVLAAVDRVFLLVMVSSLRIQENHHEGVVNAILSDTC